MNDNIINHFFGSEDQTPVKVKVSLAAAASPAGLLISYGDGGIVPTGEAVVVFHTCLLYTSPSPRDTR